MSRFAIIPAAGKPTNQILAHTNLPDTMLPINGKPVIGYILDNLLLRGIRNAIIILNVKDEHTEKYVQKKFGQKMNLVIARNEQGERGVGFSIYKAVEHLTEADEVTIYLGDTIYKGELNFETDFLVTTTEFETSDKWCFIERTEHGDKYVNKPNEYTGNGLVLAGLYHFKDVPLFKKTLHDIEKENLKIELFHLLEVYGKVHPFTLVKAEQYYDCGNIENYYRARIDFLKTRSFNTLSYNDLYGTITKSGQNKAKLDDEINWYKNIPEDLKVFSPRLISYKTNKEATSYTLEYYGYQSLADYFVFNHFDDKVWHLIIDRLFEILNLFENHTTKLAFADYDNMYQQKTIARIKILNEDDNWNKLLSQETIVINNITYHGWPYYEKKLSDLVQTLYQSSKAIFSHGDLCLSNILFDPNSRIFKLIDPRGSFGETSIYGDNNYDIAKLRHSFLGRYDFIVSDLFQLEEKDSQFELNIFDEPEHERIGDYFDKALEKNGYNLNVIKSIEALLFISMIPIHSDAPQRQKAMFLTSIRLFNSISI